MNTAIAAGALVISAALAINDTADRVRGSDIEIGHTYQAMFYLDGVDFDHSVVVAGLQANIVNQSRYGDAVTKSVLIFENASPVADAGGSRDIAFRAESSLTPVVTLANDALPGCREMARCIRLKGLTIGDEAVSTVELAGGGARSVFLGFPLASSACDGAAALCGGLIGAPSFFKTLQSNRTLTLRLDVHTVGDGVKHTTCVLPGGANEWPTILNQLKAGRWVVANCA